MSNNVSDYKKTPLHLKRIMTKLTRKLIRNLTDQRLGRKAPIETKPKTSQRYMYTRHKNWPAQTHPRSNPRSPNQRQQPNPCSYIHCYYEGSRQTYKVTMCR